MPVTQSSTQTIYVYAPDKLWAAYGAATAATLAGVVLGLASVVTGDRPYTGALSTILRITRNAELGVSIEDADLNGKGPPPKYLAKATKRVGVDGPVVRSERRPVDSGPDADSALLGSSQVNEVVYIGPYHRRTTPDSSGQ